MAKVVFRYGDDYPNQCPPEDAFSPNDISLYRICRSDSSEDINSDDFVPVWDNKNRKFPPNRECGARAISFNEDLSSLSSLRENHPNIGKRIVRVRLNESCGLLLKTSKSHYNLWDFIKPDIIVAIGDEWEEVI